MSSPVRGSADHFAPGDWNITCSMCGAKMKFSEAEQNWQGQYRHARCNEPRPAQDFVHSINSKEMAIPVSQNMAEAYVAFCTFNGRSAVVGWAEAGCMIAGRSIIYA